MLGVSSEKLRTFVDMTLMKVWRVPVKKVDLVCSFLIGNQGEIWGFFLPPKIFDVFFFYFYVWSAKICSTCFFSYLFLLWWHLPRNISWEKLSSCTLKNPLNVLVPLIIKVRPTCRWWRCGSQTIPACRHQKKQPQPSACDFQPARTTLTLVHNWVTGKNRDRVVVVGVKGWKAT